MVVDRLCYIQCGLHHSIIAPLWPDLPFSYPHWIMMQHYITYLRCQLIGQSVHKVWFAIFSVYAGHGVKGHCVVMLESQQLSYLS